MNHLKELLRLVRKARSASMYLSLIEFFFGNAGAVRYTNRKLHHHIKCLIEQALIEIEKSNQYYLKHSVKRPRNVLSLSKKIKYSVKKAKVNLARTSELNDTNIDLDGLIGEFYVEFLLLEQHLLSQSQAIESTKLNIKYLKATIFGMDDEYLRPV